ncbi:MAG TPA: dihydroxyacetone kinase subunit DhaL [Thermoleophilia bacterium]|nr:dihydroxyacetone kinase subunit DhaL [Thermoleophilia bacterium]
MSEAITRQGVETWLRAFADDVAQQRDHLTELDAAIGDADHGVNMDRGMQAVVGKLDGAPANDIGALLKLVGMTLVSTVGGAAGPLYGTLFLQMGTAAGDAVELTAEAWATALETGVRGVQARGKADRGDKTMLDALLPAVEALQQGVASVSPLTDALQHAAQAAHEGMKATVPLVARKGRASYLGERSVGHQDPGATSSWLLLKAAAEHLPGEEVGDPGPTAEP